MRIADPPKAQPTWSEPGVVANFRANFSPLHFNRGNWLNFGHTTLSYNATADFLLGQQALME